MARVPILVTAPHLRSPAAPASLEWTNGELALIPFDQQRGCGVGCVHAKADAIARRCLAGRLLPSLLWLGTLGQLPENR